MITKSSQSWDRYFLGRRKLFFILFFFISATEFFTKGQGVPLYTLFLNQLLSYFEVLVKEIGQCGGVERALDFKDELAQSKPFYLFVPEYSEFHS